MYLWYRVFGGNDTTPEPEALLAHLRQQGLEIEGQFDGDGPDWFRGELTLGDVTLVLERFHVGDEGVRAELNTWAALLETCEQSPHHVALMERTIQSAQLFTLCRPEDNDSHVDTERLCQSLCQYLAVVTAGFYQIDDTGFFAADGTLLVPDN
jgi:hypothetical protein